MKDGLQRKSWEGFLFVIRILVLHISGQEQGMGQELGSGDLLEQNYLSIIVSSSPNTLSTFSGF